MDTSRGLYFSHTMLTLAAATQKQGIALAPRFMIEDYLASGTLAIVDERELVTPAGYYVVWPTRANPAITVLTGPEHPSRIALPVAPEVAITDWTPQPPLEGVDRWPLARQRVTTH